MQRVMLDHSGVTLSPKQKRLSVGFGAGSSVQIHKTATPPAMQQRSLSTHSESKVVCDDGGTPGRRKSLHEALLMRLLSTPSDEPLFQRNSSDAPESHRTADDSFDSCLSGRSSPFELDLLHQTPDAIRCNTPPAAESIVPPNRRMQLLMRDYNSPSATARLRAVRALNSVSKRNAYGNFDVSYAEQDIITEEERQAQEKRSIQDVMREVCVYVEVRSGTDNRSDGIKEHIASLGAKVNERLLKDTTHVIFKDGLLSTYQKAKKMNIPIVSILWIEACKRHTCLMNPNDFKISNLERYENPDLFKRIRRQKSMQPGAEVAAGAKKRPNITSKTKAAVPVISPPSKLPVLHRIRKDDRLERILSDFEAENQISSSADGPIDEYDQLLQAAPMRMLERFRSTPTPMEREEENQSLTKTPTTVTNNNAAVEETPQDANEISSRRALFAGSGSKQPASITPRGRRKPAMFIPHMTNVEEEQTVAETICNTIDETPKQTSVRSRRKTIVLPPSEETTSIVPEKSSLIANRRKTIVAASESETVPSGTTTRAVRTRRSTMIPNVSGKETVTMDQSSLSEQNDLKQPEETISANNSSVHGVSVRVSSRRKTIVALKEAEPSGPAHTPVSILSKNKRSRRKTITFGNEENTPPVSAAISMDLTKTDSKAKKTIMTTRDTICSPKDMEMSSVIRENHTTNIGGHVATELTKINSNGTVISISSDEGNRRITNAPKDSRRTLFIPSVEGAMDGMTKSVHNDSIRSSFGSSLTNRRRTLFTPGHSTPMEPLEVSETPPLDSMHLQWHSRLTHADGSSIVNRPNPTSSSTPRCTVEPPVPVSAPNRGKTLLQQYEDSLIFSSTRAPDRRRRTVFDITMDIMDHRLSEINRQAAAAIVSKPQNDDANHSTEDRLASSVAPVEAALKSPTPQAIQTSMDTYYRKAAKSCEKSAQPTVAVATEEAPRKRKLFNVQTSEEEIMPHAAAVRKTPVATKRRSLAPAAASEMKSPTSSLTKKRRTTALFTSQIDSAQRQEKEAPKRNLFPIGRGLPTMASQYPTTGLQQNGPLPRQYLATTNLHTEQSTFVKEAIASLDGFIVEANVTDNTTHLVTLESRRTINLLRALIRGLWILRYEWIVESYRAGRWLPEERFELRDFSRAVQLNRSERQAFGSQYRNELFSDFAPFWISPRCAIPVQQLRELIVLCRGKVSGNASRAKFLVVEPNDNDAAPIEGQIVVAPTWILDSITINKVKKLSKKYRIE
uniref:BRCT domain-containing protein n=1 Tax=Anopheles christyi TaxID=43041 RepID=A0A182K3G7_9DIPT